MYFSSVLRGIIVLINILRPSVNSLEWQNFETCLTERGFIPDNIIKRSNTSKEYNELNGEQWNIYNWQIYPAGYLLPRNSRDVQVAIICSRKDNIRVVAKSGGHGFTKFAYGDSNSVVIDMQRLNTVSVNKLGRTGLVGAGVRVGRLAYELWNQGKFVTPHGVCPQVGISGLALGGGTGLLTRLHGLTSDNIVEMEFVDATGNLLTVNSNNYSDLFWALRGGGSGSFGIVTSFKIKLYVAPTVVYAQMHYTDFSSFPTVFSIWCSFANSNPPAYLNSHFYVINNTLILHFIDTQDEVSRSQCGVSRLQAILNRFPRPNNISIESLDYSEFTVKLSVNAGVVSPGATSLLDLASSSRIETVGYFRAHSFFTQKILNDSEIFRLYQLLINVVRLPRVEVYFYAFGGAINNLNPTDTAFVHRGPQTKFECAISAVNSNPDWEGFKMVRHFFMASKEIVNHKESYQNYIDDSMEDYLERYYGKNLNRLIHIKNKYDPDNFFHNPQSIPIEYD